MVSEKPVQVAYRAGMYQVQTGVCEDLELVVVHSVVIEVGQCILKQQP